MTFSDSVLTALRKLNDEPIGHTPWGEGHDAAMEGCPLDNCPYDLPEELSAHAEWVAGWWAAYEDRR